MLNSFYEYMGSGAILIWYLAAVLYLFLKEKRKEIRVFFLYAPVLVLLLFFNPVFSKVFARFLGTEIYYRMLWLLPILPTLAYSAVKICREETEKKALCFAGAAAALIVISGSLIYRNPYYSKAENIHHVPWEVVEICDRIIVEGREVRAAFPRELLLFVRQYTPYVCLPYGRDVVLYEGADELDGILEKDEIEVERMAQLAKEKECHYVIFSEEKTLTGKMEDYDYELFDRVGEYLLYKDTTMNFGLQPK